MPRNVETKWDDLFCPPQGQIIMVLSADGRASPPHLGAGANNIEKLSKARDPQNHSLVYLPITLTKKDRVGVRKREKVVIQF